MTGRALQGVQLGPHRLDVPGRHEAEALTDCCPRCDHPARPADEVRHDRITGRCAAYRCRVCDAAWLREWPPPGQVPAARWPMIGPPTEASRLTCPHGRARSPLSTGRVRKARRNGSCVLCPKPITVGQNVGLIAAGWAHLSPCLTDRRKLERAP